MKEICWKKHIKQFLQLPEQNGCILLCYVTQRHNHWIRFVKSLAIIWECIKFGILISSLKETFFEVLFHSATLFNRYFVTSERGAGSPKRTQSFSGHLIKTNNICNGRFCVTFSVDSWLMRQFLGGSCVVVGRLRCKLRWKTDLKWNESIFGGAFSSIYWIRSWRIRGTVTQCCCVPISTLWCWYGTDNRGSRSKVES